jgi:predicted aldo/keto reductase-like oxidoreductase
MNAQSHIEENIRIADATYPASLMQEELNLISRVEKKYRELMQAGCTGCRYCMPCPSGVNIPACFELYNDLHMHDDVLRAKISYLGRHAGILGEPSNASLCENCGNCENLCPQHLPIQDLLQDVAKEFEGRWFKPSVWFAKRIMAFRKRGTLRRGKRPKKVYG